MDVWTFEAEAGQVLYVTVDTIADATAFDPALEVVGPEECVVVSADDEFDCTYEPPSYGCPSSRFTASATGTYYVAVRALGSCRSDEAAYAVDVRTDP